MSETKIKIGNGQKKSEKWLKSSICLSDIPEDKTFEYNGKTYVKVDINISESPNKFGKDVNITIDDWKPNKKNDTKEDWKEKESKEQFSDDLPF